MMILPKNFYTNSLHFQDANNTMIERPSQPGTGCIKQEKDVVHKQIFLPYPVPCTDVPADAQDLSSSGFPLLPGVIIPTLDSFNVYDDMVQQPYENTSQDSQVSQVTSTASSSNWEDEMQQLIEEIVCYFFGAIVFIMHIMDYKQIYK